MSGLEIAGLVLGALPLVVTAIQQYGEGLSTLQRYAKYERELRSITRNLETERVKLLNVCEKLLCGLVPDSRIDLMIKNPVGDHWRDADTQAKIRARLWTGFDVFEATIRDIKTAVDDMTTRINSQRGANVSKLKKAVFTLSRSKYADLLSTIREGISNLENLTDRNIELEPARRVRSRGKLVTILRDMSQSLYQALQSSLDCPCQHDLSLRLESRSADMPPNEDNERTMDHIEFQLAVSYKTSTIDPSRRLMDDRNWEEVMIKAATATRTTSFSSVLPAPTTQIMKAQGKRSIGFSSLAAILSSTNTTGAKTDVSMDVLTSIPTITLGISSTALDNPATYLNLCEKIRRAHKQKQTDFYGTIIDKSSQTTRRYGVYPVSTPWEENTRTWSIISLEEVLEGNKCILSLSYQDRLRLAVDISSSILQLHGSPWLPNTISSREIYFFRKQSYQLYDNPFVMATLPNNGLPYKKDLPGTPLVRNPTLISLAVLLIELNLGKSFESLRTTQEISLLKTSPFVDYITSKRLLGQVWMSSSNYGTAVMRCLDGELHSHNLDFHDEDFCQEVYSGVVALLLKDLENS